MEFSKPLTVSAVDKIPGMLVIDLPVHGDNRGWFKENWQREKMIVAGLPDFGPVQNNISFNEKAGTTRGIHAEPWDKFVSVATGKIFGAWVDLREGSTFGNVFTREIDPSVAVFVPRGVGNAFQTLEDDTAYAYLVNDHWSANAQGQYTFLNLADESVAISWPIPLAGAELSAKDLAHPALADVEPMAPKKVLVLGANGQLGKALKVAFGDNQAVEYTTRAEFDLSVPEDIVSRNWAEYSTVINAAAYTDVDEAETDAGRRASWAANASGVAALAAACTKHQLTLVHVSSDYVFDGTEAVHTEDEAFSPLGVYGQSKAAGDIAVATVPQHYIIRTSWVIGDGKNFVATMQALAAKGIEPRVVNDQFGRLSFTEDIASGIRHLLEINATFGTYNLSNDGEPSSWADIAAMVFELSGKPRSAVTGITTEEFFAGKSAAPRPANSMLDLTKIKNAGFAPRDYKEALRAYLS